jgi:uncharacterized sporulation protein YeaH/YhbH (DUF444 family)
LSTFLDKDFSSDRESINKCVNEFQSIIDLASKNLLKLKRRNLDERLMLQTKNGLPKSVDLKDTSLEN